MIKFKNSSESWSLVKYIHHCELESFSIAQDFSYEIGDDAPEHDSLT